MDKKKIKIVHVSAEVAPFSKTGGLADVARSLPEALFKLDHDVRIITPFYGKLIDEKEYNLKMIFKNINVVIDPENSIKVNFWQGKLNGGLPVYFVDIKKYFSKHKRIYGSDKENVRFLTFNVAVLKLLNILELVPDIIHCHDWHSGAQHHAHLCRCPLGAPEPRAACSTRVQAGSGAHCGGAAHFHGLDFGGQPGWPHGPLAALVANRRHRRAGVAHQAAPAVVARRWSGTGCARVSVKYYYKKTC